MTDLESFLAERERTRKEFARSERLVKEYKKNMPDIAPIWDTTPESISFTDICTSITSSGVRIYSCKIDELWAGLNDPAIFEAGTLWGKLHDPRKIAGVIEAWSKGKALSPIFLLKHEVLEKWLVADGRHRLTVSRASRASEVMFMVESANATWVSRTFPSAVCITQF
ncbi:hypothetical protein [Ottowia thiooxydans]|uniref:hypothetical protein n=1 Tax=Ottowia thiooxydans TaxID=219182 RepID=UPI00048E87F0|nr:hypothetical protein [Ottowia thiooxydans]